MRKRANAKVGWSKEVVQVWIVKSRRKVCTMRLRSKSDILAYWRPVKHHTEALKPGKKQKVPVALGWVAVEVCQNSYYVDTIAGAPRLWFQQSSLQPQDPSSLSMRGQKSKYLFASLRTGVAQS